MPRAPSSGSGSARCRTGPTNSVLDVAGVGLGHATVVRDEPAPPAGGVSRARASRRSCSPRTPTRRPLAAGGAVLNGAGECTGFLTAQRVGPCSRRRSSSPRRCSSAGCTTRPARSRWSDTRCGRRRGDPGGRRVRRLLPQRLPRRCRSRRDDVRAAYEAALDVARRLARRRPRARSAPAPACRCLGFKGGIGTASRVTPDGHTVGGAAADQLRRARAADRRRASRSGRLLARPDRTRARRGRPARASGSSSPTRPSTASGCARLARRVGLGLARTGSAAHHGSGEIFLAASTTVPHGPRRRSRRPDARVAGRALDPLFAAVVEATEEAVLNSMLGADDDGRPRRQHQRGPRPRDRGRALLPREARAVR